MSGYAVTMLSGNIDTRSRSDRRLYFLTDAILLPIVTLGIWGLVVMYRLIKYYRGEFHSEL